MESKQHRRTTWRHSSHSSSDIVHKTCSDPTIPVACLSAHVCTWLSALLQLRPLRTCKEPVCFGARAAQNKAIKPSHFKWPQCVEFLFFLHRVSILTSLQPPHNRSQRAPQKAGWASLCKCLSLISKFHLGGGHFDVNPRPARFHVSLTPAVMSGKISEQIRVLARCR